VPKSHCLPLPALAALGLAAGLARAAEPPDWAAGHPVNDWVRHSPTRDRLEAQGEVNPDARGKEGRPVYLAKD
jgi:hypothetical protein